MSLTQKQKQTPHQKAEQLFEAIHQSNSRKSVVIDHLRKAADYLDSQQFSRMTPASITSSIGCVAGLVLAPFTAGATLGLAVTAGMALMKANDDINRIAAEIADRAVNSEEIMRAQAEIDSYNQENEKLHQLMNTVEWEESEADFAEEFVKSFNMLVTKTGAHVATAGGKVALEILKTGENAVKVKFSGTVISEITVSLDLYTVVSDRIKINNKTPSETAEYIRKLADDMETEGQRKEMEEKEELKKRAEKLTRERNRQKQQWIDSMKTVGEDVAFNMGALAVKYECLTKQVSVIKSFSICTHIIVRCFVIYILPHIYPLNPNVWIRFGSFVSLVYDGIFLLLTIDFEVRTYRTIEESRIEMEKGLYAAQGMIKTAPAVVFAPAERRSRSLKSLTKGDLNECNKYYNYFELGLMIFTSLLNVVIICYNFSFIYVPKLPFGEYESTAGLLLNSSTLVITIGGQDLLFIIWLLVSFYLLHRSKKRHYRDSCLARDINSLGNTFLERILILSGDHRLPCQFKTKSRF